MIVICQLLGILRVRILGPDESGGLFQAVGKFSRMITEVMKNVPICVCTSDIPLNTFIKRFMN